MPFTAFDIILISPEENHPQELNLLLSFFEKGLSTFHLRKPLASKIEIREYLNNIPTCFHDKIMLHQHHDLIREFNLKGLHFPEKVRDEAIQFKGLKSTSFHDLDSIKNCTCHFDYAFLSPIFPSISKKGYEKEWNTSELKSTIQKATFPIIALGGVDQENIQKCIKIGFQGAAVLGAVWGSKNPLKAWKELTPNR